MLTHIKGRNNALSWMLAGKPIQGIIHPVAIKDNTEARKWVRNMVSGKRLRELRESKDLTQTELSKRSGVNQDSISRYESSQRQPTVDHMYRMSKVLGKPMEYFMLDEI